MNETDRGATDALTQKQLRQATARANSVRRAERVAQAMALRRAGATYEAIGQQLGVSHVAAWGLVGRALRAVIARTRVDAEALVALEVDRLDALLLSAWSGAQRGNVASILAALKVCESRRRLLGLDRVVEPVPPQPEGTDYSGWTIEELRARWESLSGRAFGHEVVEAQALPAPVEPAPVAGPSDADLEAMKRDARLRAYELELAEREARRGQ
jgi:hypothetical protein